MAHIETSEKGFVSVKGLSESSKESDLHAVMLFLADGLSYLNYAMTGSTMGMQNKEEDLESAHFLLTCAMDSLLYIEEKTEGDTEEQNVNKKKEK